MLRHRRKFLFNLLSAIPVFYLPSSFLKGKSALESGVLEIKNKMIRNAQDIGCHIDPKYIDALVDPVNILQEDHDFKKFSIEYTNQNNQTVKIFGDDKAVNFVILNNSNLSTT